MVRRSLNWWASIDRLHDSVATTKIRYYKGPAIFFRFRSYKKEYNITAYYLKKSRWFALVYTANDGRIKGLQI